MANSIDEALKRAAQAEKYKEAVETLKNNNISKPEIPGNIRPIDKVSEKPPNPYGLNEKPLLEPTPEQLESAQRGPGNNYMYPNAVDRAKERPSHEPQKTEPEPEKER